MKKTVAILSAIILAAGSTSMEKLANAVALALDEAEPTVENIKAGNYFLRRPFVMATKGEISKQNANVQAFFEYLSSEEGKEIIEAVGLITVD